MEEPVKRPAVLSDDEYKDMMRDTIRATDGKVKKQG